MGRYAIPVVSRLLELNGGKFISAAQVARGGPAKDYVAKLQDAGKLDGRRCGCSRRRISDRVFQVLRADETEHGKGRERAFGGGLT